MRRLFLTAALGIALGASHSIAQESKKAVFAGGCFWCVESDFDKLDGVLFTVSGYTGGHVDEPTYKQVVAGDTGHREAVEVTYDPGVVSYDQLLDVFWRSVDPTDAGGQFCDRGFSYTTAVYVDGEQERELAERSKAEAATTLDQTIVTPIEEAATFWPAEVYHQDYYRKNPRRYTFYRWSCGRDSRVRDVWGEQAYRGIEGHS